MKMSALSVLVLEDHPLQRAVIVCLLQRCGLTQIIEAEEGGQALAMLKERGGVDIAICDLRMSGMDGLGFLHRISWEARVRAVMISSEVDTTLRNAVGALVDMWDIAFLGDLGKPASLTRLRDLLARYQPDPARKDPANRPCKRPMPTRDEVMNGLYRHEFEAYFQPKTNLYHGRLTGAEVLARWDHPTHGILSPQHFLPHLEGDEAIDLLFWQLLEQGLSLQQDHPGLGLAFNVHPSQLSRPGFTGQLQRQLQRYRVPASLLTLEITESGALAVTPDVLAVLLRLRLMGCVLALDDFGAGYSSLGRLCELPFNQIKIDRTFVQGIHRGSRGYAVIRSAVGLANSLDLSLVIEGVEHTEQLTCLQELGCDEVQGFLFGRPVCASRFSEQLPSLKMGIAARVE